MRLLPASWLAPLPARLVSSMMAPFVLTTTEEKKKGRRRQGGREEGREGEAAAVAALLVGGAKRMSRASSLPLSRAAQALRHLISSACDLCSSLLGAGN